MAKSKTPQPVKNIPILDVFKAIPDKEISKRAIKNHNGKTTTVPPTDYSTALDMGIKDGSDEGHPFWHAIKMDAMIGKIKSFEHYKHLIEKKKEKKKEKK